MISKFYKTYMVNLRKDEIQHQRKRHRYIRACNNLRRVKREIKFLKRTENRLGFFLFFVVFFFELSLLKFGNYRRFKKMLLISFWLNKKIIRRYEIGEDLLTKARDFMEEHKYKEPEDGLDFNFGFYRTIRKAKA